MTTYLVDSSAWAITQRSTEARDRIGDLAPRYLAATTEPVMFELLTTAIEASDMATLRLQLAALPLLPAEPQDWARAFDVYHELAEQGPLHHRQVARTDLLVAAVAERHRASILHYDHDFDVIAAVTGQPAEWIVPRGSL